MSKLEEIISSTIYDLTHLEINTIIKDEMSASKAPSSPRLILHDLSKKFHLKLISLGEKYLEFIGTENENAVQLFRGNELFMGSAYNSFKELSLSALNANIRLTNDKNKVKGHYSEDEINSDIKMFQRIETISNDVRRILKIVDTIKGEPTSEGETYKFDEPEFVNNFRILKSEEVKKLELKLDLRQLMLFKKANDIGTEKVILQTIIGIDGDVTTRIANAFADNPVKFINEIHNESIGISVKFWESLVNVVVKLGKSILDNVTNKK